MYRKVVADAYGVMDDLENIMEEYVGRHGSWEFNFRDEDYIEIDTYEPIDDRALQRVLDDLERLENTSNWTIVEEIGHDNTMRIECFAEWKKQNYVTTVGLTTLLGTYPLTSFLWLQKWQSIRAR